MTDVPLFEIVSVLMLAVGGTAFTLLSVLASQWKQKRWMEWLGLACVGLVILGVVVLGVGTVLTW